MTKRLPAEPAPGPLEDYAARFDDLFATLAQRQAFRRYLQGLLLPAERNKTLTALANTQPVVGAQRKEAQGLQWFLSESSWSPEELNRRRVDLMLEDPTTAPNGSGVLVIDETGDRKDGTATAHVGKQYLGGIGKIDNGVVSVSSLWVDERIYYPLEVKPYTPARHFEEGGKANPEFRTKPQIALELVERAVEMEIPFRAVVGDILYGEHRKFKEGLEDRQIPYVLALKPSHAWWHRVDQVGWVEGVARASHWGGPEDPGEWVGLERRFRDGRAQVWWALEAECAPYGPEKPHRLIVATTDPATLPNLTSWYLATNLPAPGSKRAEHSELDAADLAEVVRLYSLRSWIEQSYKQIKNSLGWAHYQVRKDIAIRRHWQLVMCAFTFCWWACSESWEVGSPPVVVFKRDKALPALSEEAGRGEKEGRVASCSGGGAVVAGGVEKGEELVGAVRAACALLEGVLRAAPAQGATEAA
jgi:hypothetical protein